MCCGGAFRAGPSRSASMGLPIRSRHVIDLTAETNQQDHCRVTGGCQATIQKHHGRRLFTHPRELARSKCWFRRPESVAGRLAGGEVEQADPERRRGPCRRLRDHGVLHPQRAHPRDADLQRHRAARPAGRHRAGVPAQPQRPQPAHGLDLDDRHDLRPHRRRPRGQPPADRGQRGGPGARPPGGDRRERGPPGPGVPAHRGDDRPSGRRHHLRHARRAVGHGAPRPVRPAGRAAQLRRPADRPPVGDARRRDGRPGRGPGPAGRGCRRGDLRRRRGPGRPGGRRARRGSTGCRRPWARRVSSSRARCRARGR